LNIKMEEMPPAVARYLSYKLSIQGASQATVYEYGIDLCVFLRYVFRKEIKENETNLSNISDEMIRTISSQQIYDYLLYAATVMKNQNASRARKLSSIRGFFHFLCVKEKMMETDPSQNIDSPKVKHALPRFLSLDESRLLLKTVKDSVGENSVRDFAIMTLFLNCGLRVSELVGINCPDLTDDLTQMIVTGKGNKQRMIYLNESCRSALGRYLKERGSLYSKDETALFVSRNHRRLSVKTCQWLVYKYLKLAGLEQKNYSVHKLRHTAATLMYETGKVDVRVLKDILGHEQLNTTQIYTHVSDEHMKQAMGENPLNDSE